jgi:hypothetical protein
MTLIRSIEQIRQGHFWPCPLSKKVIQNSHLGSRQTSYLTQPLQSWQSAPSGVTLSELGINWCKN